MTTGMSEEQIYEQAKKRVKAKRDFYGNLGVWAAVNLILFIIWALSNFGGYPWFLWPLCIWGAFVLIQYFKVFVLKPKSDEGEIQKEADKIRREQR